MSFRHLSVDEVAVVETHSLARSFADMHTTSPEDDGSGSSLVYTSRDVVLLILVPQVESKDPWTWEQPPQQHPVTFETLENLRGTYTSRKEFVERTA